MGDIKHGREPVALARDGVHEKILARLNEMPRGTVLDVPTGYGALAQSLNQMGFVVSCCDIDPSVFVAEGLRVDRGDLNNRIPYDDAAFDYVCFLEAIEHTENPYCAVREIARVLKPRWAVVFKHSELSEHRTEAQVPCHRILHKTGFSEEVP